MPVAYLGLGTNLGSRKRNLGRALKLIGEQVGIVKATSSFYDSKPQGFRSSHRFLNAVCCVQTELEPMALLAQVKAIERSMGRIVDSTNCGYQDRIIDIDILYYDQLVMQTDKLTIPHPRIGERDFVLRPLAELQSCGCQVGINMLDSSEVE